MKKSIHPFLSGIIDYAGLYPPASLDLQDSFKKYLEHAHSKESWMLSKFVVGTSLLSDLSELINSTTESPDPFLITLVAAPSTTVDEFKSVLNNTIAQITEVINNSGKSIRIPTLEVKLPSEIDYKNLSELSEVIDFTVHQLNSSAIFPDQAFFEIPGFEFATHKAIALTQAISNHNDRLETESLDNYESSGFKVRCGGVEAFQFPPIEYLVEAISEATKSNVPLKFTAGLHHPVRHYNESVSAKMHGFLNVFGGTILYNSKPMDDSILAEILSDENPNNFSFSDTGFSWKNHSVKTQEIHKLRAFSATSFGSCSFDEPVEDLQELTLLN